MTTPTSLLLRNIRREHGFEPLRVEGRIPTSVEGTLYRVGPGAFDTFGVPFTHLFESDGAITAIRIDGGGASGAIRMVESQGRKDELAAGKPLYGYNAPYLTRARRRFQGKKKNLGNTTPMLWQGRLFALCEAFEPVEVDPETLATVRETDLGGLVRGPFSAHPHRVAKRRAIYNFGIRYGKETFVDLYELPDEGHPRHLATIPLPRGVLLHDFAVTERRILFLVSPFEVELPRAILGIGPFGKLFRYRPEHGTEVIEVMIDAPTEVRRFTTEAFFQWHFANAFEDAGGLVVDFVRYRDTATFQHIGTDVPLGGELVRARIDDVSDRIETLRVIDGTYEFPSVDPRISGSTSRVVFTTSEGPGRRGIARHDLESGRRDTFSDTDETWYSEPVFVPDRSRPDEGAGHLLSLVIDARTQTSHVGIFDAETPSAGPVAKLCFDEALPITFHGTFRSAHG